MNPPPPESLLFAANLGRGLVGRSTVSAIVVRNSKTAKPSRKEGEGVVRAIIAVEVSVGSIGRRRGIVGSRESSLGRRVAEGGSRLGDVCRSVACIHLAHGGVRPRGSAKAGRQGIVIRRGSELLTKAAKPPGRRRKRARGRSARHRARGHAEARWRIHRGREGGISDNGRARARSTAAQTVDVFREVMVTTSLRATLPVTGPEWDHASVAHATGVAHPVSSVVGHVRRDHRWGAIAVRTIAHRVGGSSHGGEGATEAGRAALEVGEAAGRTGPVARSRAVLGRREGSEDFRRTVKDPAGRRGDLDGLLVQSTTVHAKTLGSLQSGKTGSACKKNQTTLQDMNRRNGNSRTSSWDENTAKPVPVGLCWSGVRRVQKAIGRPPYWVNQLSSSDWVVS